MKDIIFDAIFLAFLSSLSIAAGLRLLRMKRPLIVSSRRWGILCCAPMLIISITVLWRGYPWEDQLLEFCAYAIIGCVAIILGLILWASGGGGVVIGATETTARDALRQAFGRLGLPYEESAKVFRLPELNNEMFAQSGPINGMFVLRFKRIRGLRAMGQLTRRLLPEVSEFFRTAPARINKRAGYSFIVIGIALLLLDSLITYERLSIRARMRAIEEGHTKFSRLSQK